MSSTIASIPKIEVDVNTQDNYPKEEVTDIVDFNVGEFVNDVGSGIINIGSEIGNIANGIKENFNSFFSDAPNYLTAAIQSVGDTIETAAATGAMAISGAVNGVGNVLEDIVDFAAILGTGVATVPAAIVDGVSYLSTGEGAHAIDNVWAGTMDFVSTTWIDNAFENLYTNTEIGKGINEKSLEFFKYGNMGYEGAKTVGYIGGTIALTIATGGIAGGAEAAAVTVGGTAKAGAGVAIRQGAKSVTKVAPKIAFAEGTGRSAGEAWREGASAIEGLGYGVASGLWEGLQWYAGGKLAGLGGKAIAFDAGSGALDTPVRSALQGIYSDNDLITRFEENGGVQGMLLGLVLGGGLSSIGEVSAIKNFFGNEHKSFSAADQKGNADFRIKSSDVYATDESIASLQSSSENLQQEIKALIGDFEPGSIDDDILEHVQSVLSKSNASSKNVSTLVSNLITIFREKHLDLAINLSGNAGFLPPGPFTKKALIALGPSGWKSGDTMTFLHESGHALWHLGMGEGESLTITAPSEELISALNSARNNIDSNHNAFISLLKESQSEYELQRRKTIEWYDGIRQSEKEKIENIVDELYSGENIEEISQMLKDAKQTLNIDEVKSQLEEAGISSEDIEAILSNKELTKSILVRQNAITKQAEHFNSKMADYSKSGDYRKISSILNSITRSWDDIVDEAGEKVSYTYGHSNNYWTSYGSQSEDFAIRKSLDELMADYFSISASGRVELIDKLKSVVGNELFEALDNEYGRIIENLKKQEIIGDD